MISLSPPDAANLALDLVEASRPFDGTGSNTELDDLLKVLPEGHKDQAIAAFAGMLHAASTLVAATKGLPVETLYANMRADITEALAAIEPEGTP